jgi:hypothetical protein
MGVASSALFMCLSLAALCLVGCAEGEPDTAALAQNPSGDAPAMAQGADEESAAPAATTLRFVNLWVHEGAGAPVDVYRRTGLRGETLLYKGVGFGEVSPAGAIPPDTALYVYRAGDPQAGAGLGSPAFIASVDAGDLALADRLTLVLRYYRPLREGRLAGASQVFADSGDSVVNGMPARPVDGAMLVAYSGAADVILGKGHKGFRFGTPGEGCLSPAGEKSRPGISISIGGRGAALTYDVAPGALQVAAYEIDDGKPCSGTPRIGPVEIDVAAAGRTYLFAYGTGPDDLRLLPLMPAGEH